MAQQVLQNDARQIDESDDGPIALTRGDDPRVDSRVVARRLGRDHQNVYEMVKDYQSDFEQLGILRFETGEIKGRGQPEKFVLLNEDQAYLLLAYSRNTKRVRQAKIALVMAFRAARLAADITKTEYLPTYHELHDQVGLLASGSGNARFVHMNVNKAINQAIGIDAGERGRLGIPRRSLLVVAQSLGCLSMAGAKDHHDGYQLLKKALQNIEALRIS